MMRLASVALFVFAACVGAFSLSGCSGNDDSERATAVADKAAAALNKSIRTETESKRLILRIQMVPEFGLGRQELRELGTAGIKTLDEADGLRSDARKQLETAQRLYASIDGMDTPEEFKQWVAMVVLFANKWGEVLDLDEADSATRREALNLLVDGTGGTGGKNRKEFGALIDDLVASSKTREPVVSEMNRLAAEADGFAQSLE